MPIKTYSEHLRDAKGCSQRWRILTLKPSFNKSSTENLTPIRIVPCRCNSKACPDCSRLYYNKIRKNFRTISVSNRWRFFTLTSIHVEGCEKQELELLEVHFSELRKKLKRKFPEFQYFAVKELSPSGMWHIHGLWNIYLPILQLSYWWKSISGAYRCDLQKVRNPVGAINYIFKYCFKSVNNHEEKRSLYECNSRKFTTSRGLLNKCNNQNPYTSEVGITYSVPELKEKLLNILVHSEYTTDDFSSFNYPYFFDLILNCFHFLFCESPPELCLF